MSLAPLMAFAAGAAAVLAAWEGLAALDGRAPLRVLDRWLAPLRAGREPTLREQRRLALVGAATLCAAGWLVAGVAGAVVLALAGPAAVRQALALRRRRRRAQLSAGAPAVARALADALAGGHSIRAALLVAARSRQAEGGGSALRQAGLALELGEPTEVVLEDLRRAAGDPAWDTLTAAVLLQADAGGDLAGLLRDLATRLEQARRDEAEARTATAQARFTAWLVTALPAGAALLAELGSPGFVASLAREPLSAALAATSLVLQAAALLAVRRISRAPER